ncbi:MAG: ferredoxin [Armatimonadota bacterium]
MGGIGLRPEIDESLCIGDGICADICPEVFEMGDDQLAHVINENPSEELYERVKEAADACPTGAITVHEE